MNTRKLASLAAVSVGALALTAEKAEGGIIYSGALNGGSGVPVGHLHASTSQAIFNTFHLGGGPSFQFVAADGNAGMFFMDLSARADSSFASNGATFVERFNAGANWTGVGTHHFVTGVVAARTGTGTHGGPSYSDKFVLFGFKNNSDQYYGWIELNLTLTASVGPNIDVLGYAYDNTPGEYIDAGQEGAAPEPSTLATTGLAALVLGAAGRRRWRRTRKA